MTITVIPNPNRAAKKLAAKLAATGTGNGSDGLAVANELYAVPYLRTLSHIAQNVPVTPAAFVTGANEAARNLIRSQIRAGTYGGDCTTFLQDWATALSGRNPHLSAGIWNQSGPITIGSYTTLSSDGYSAVLNATTDTEQVITPAVAGQYNEGIRIGRLRLNDSRTLTQAGAPTPVTRTKFQVVLTNTIDAKCHEVTTNCNLQSQTNPNLNNVGGIWLRALSGDISYVNKLDDCWLRAGSLQIDGTDNQVRGGFYWGFANQYAIRVNAGNNRILGADIIASLGNGGIWCPSVVEFLSVVGCFFDGSNVPGVLTGHAIYGALADAVIGSNVFWYSQRCAINLYQAEDVEISGNDFKDNNRSNGGWSDILLKPIAGSTCRNVKVNGGNFSNSVASGAGRANCFQEDDSANPGGVKANRINGASRSYSGGSGYNKYINSVGRNAAAFERTSIGNNTNMGVKNGGTSNIPAGLATRTITHGLEQTPYATEVEIRFTNSNLAGRTWSIQNITATTFDVVSNTAVVADANFEWTVNLE